jgi:hypothetical protein
VTDVEMRVASSRSWGAADVARQIAQEPGKGILAATADAALDSGLCRVQLLAWRDLDDP